MHIIHFYVILKTYFFLNTAKTWSVTVTVVLVILLKRDKLAGNKSIYSARNIFYINKLFFVLYISTASSFCFQYFSGLDIRALKITLLSCFQNYCSP